MTSLCPSLHSGVFSISGDYGTATLEVDKTAYNRASALDNILLVLFVLLYLGIFVVALYATLSKTLVAPLERILASVQKNAS